MMKNKTREGKKMKIKEILLKCNFLSYHLIQFFLSWYLLAFISIRKGVYRKRRVKFFLSLLYIKPKGEIRISRRTLFLGKNHELLFVVTFFYMLFYYCLCLILLCVDIMIYCCFVFMFFYFFYFCYNCQIFVYIYLCWFILFLL